MAESYRCPQCGAEVPGDAPQGLCPNCVLKAGFGTQQTGSGSQAGSGSAGSFDARFVPPTPAELAPHFPDLEILELVGRGGMGMVYKARQKRLDRFVALKILSPKIGQDPAFAERFAREARAMAMLSHPHIVAVHDFGQTTSPLALVVPPLGGIPPEGGTTSSHLPSPVIGRGAGGEGCLYYFLMEFVDGLTLRQLLDAGKLAPEEALAIVPQICEALQYAHDKGVVHRDIKPENILMDRSGQVKIADFGLVKLMGQDGKDFTITGAGQVMGTPNYMAPEQIEHPQEVDHRADIYSLGVVFYQMLTGELPIGRFAPPSKKVQIDVRLDEVVLRALEKEPEQRYQQASDIKSRVETIVTTPQLVSGSSLVSPPDDVQHADTTPPNTGAAGSTPAKPSRMFGIPLTRVRDGRQVVYWPGVCAATALLVVGGPLIVVLAYLSFAYVSVVPGPEGRLGPNPALLYWGVFLGFALFFGWALGFVMLIVKVREGLAAPIDRPAPRDRTAQPAPADDAAVAEARLQVQGPAIGLLVLGILQLLMVPVIFAVFLFAELAYSGRAASSDEVAFALFLLAVVVPVLVAAISIFTIAAALKMKRLEGYGLAIAASILALVASPSNLIGLAIGIWSLVVLSRPAIGKAFERNRRRKPARPAATRRQRTMGIAALVLCLAAFPILISGLASGATPASMGIFIIAAEIVAFLLGILGRRSLAGKVATIFSGIGLLAGTPLLMLPLSYDPGGAASIARRQPVVFGPVIQRTVETDIHGKYAIDLDTGVLYTPPANLKSEQELNHWIRAVGADALGVLGEGLSGRDMLVCAAAPRSWDQPPAELQHFFASLERPNIFAEIKAEMPGVPLPATYAFKTREGGMGLLQIVGFSENPAGVKIRYKLVSEAGKGPAEAPASTTGMPQKSLAGPTDDMQEYLNLTQQLVSQRRYEEALDRFVWFHDHALEHNPGMSGVRLSFALSYWKELGNVYPPAKQAMVDMRNRKTRQLRERKASAALFADVAALNRTLGENAETVRLFGEIGKTDAALATQCWIWAREAVFLEKQYEIARKYIPAPLDDYAREKAGYDENIALYKEPGIGGPQFRQWNEDHFVDACLQLIELAAFSGDQKAAEEIRKRAANVVDDRRLRKSDVPQSRVDSQRIPKPGQPAETPATGPKPEAPWGDWNAGWSMRLRTAKATCVSEELPEFTVDLRKRENGEPDAVQQSLHNWLLDVDGRRFRFDIFTTSREHKQVFEPGTTRQGFIAFRFHKDETRLHVRTGEHGTWINSYGLDPVGKDGQVLSHPKPEDRFRLTPGKHVVRIAFPMTPNPPAGYTEADLARFVFSNPVEVEIQGTASGGTKDECPDIFGPVIERMVEDAVSGKSAIDLDTGKLYTGPQVVKDASELDRWMKATGVDALGETLPTVRGPAVRGLCGFDMVAVVVENDRWNLPVTELKATLAMGKPGQAPMIGKGVLPATYLFKTREGGMGVLQIVGSSDKPQGVKIRYKLLRKPVPAAAVAMVDSAKTQMGQIRNSLANARDEETLRRAQSEIKAKNEEFEALLKGTVAEIPMFEQHERLKAYNKALMGKDKKEMARLRKEMESAAAAFERLIRGGRSPVLQENTQAKPATKAMLKRVHHFTTGTSVRAIACSADGKLVAVANGNPTYHLQANGTSRVKDNWKPSTEILDAETGKTVVSLNLTTHDEETALAATKRVSPFEVKALAFSPDGSVVAVGTSSGQVKLFNARSGDLVRSLVDKRAKLADQETPEKLQSLPRAMGSVASLAFSPDGNLLAVCGSSFDDMDDHDRDGVRELTISTTGPGRLKVWEVKTGTLKHDLVGHDEHANAVAFSPDGKWLASAGDWLNESGSGTGVIIWNPHTGTKIRTFATKANGGTWSVAFSPNSKLVVISSRTFDKDSDTSTSSINLLHAGTGIMEWRQTVPGWGQPAIFSPDGKSVAVLCGGDSIRFFETETGTMMREMRSADSPHGGRWSDFAIAPQGHRLAIGGVDKERKGSVELWDFDGLPE